jgi:hypothetical protein
VDSEDAFSNALTLGHEISIVTGFNNKKHAYSVDSDYKYMNAIVNKVTEREEKNFNKEQEQIYYDNLTHGIVIDKIAEKPKKVLRPKLITICLLIIIVLLLIICPRSCRNSQMNQSLSVSGDTIQIQNIK